MTKRVTLYLEYLHMIYHIAYQYTLFLIQLNHMTFNRHKIRNMKPYKADNFAVDLQEQLSSKLIFDNSTSTSSQLELFYKTFYEVLEAHASRKKANAKKTC